MVNVHAYFTFFDSVYPYVILNQSEVIKIQFFCVEAGRSMGGMRGHLGSLGEG